MKRTALVSITSFVFLLIASAVCVILAPTDFGDGWTYFITGVVTLLVSAALAYFASERPVLNVICFSISAVALGFLIRSWYIFRGFDNDFVTVLLVCLASTLYLWVFCLLCKIPFVEKHKTLFAIIYAVISLVGYLVVMLNTKTTYVSTFGYYMIVETAFIYALVREVNDIRELIRTITLCTFSVFGVAVILGVLLLAGGGGGDCDCGDCSCDCGDCGCDLGSEKKKKSDGKTE